MDSTRKRIKEHSPDEIFKQSNNGVSWVQNATMAVRIMCKYQICTSEKYSFFSYYFPGLIRVCQLYFFYRNVAHSDWSINIL